MDGSLLHVPGKHSFFSSKDLLKPASVPRYVKLAEQLRSMRINGLVVSVSFNDHSFVNVIPQLRALSEFLDGYGIQSKTESERMLQAVNVLSQSVQRHNGAIFYRTWMTGALQDKEYKLFIALSSKLPKNVYIVSKIGYGDFGIKEIPHPLFGHIQPASQHIAEFQIFGEYRGLHSNACEMATNWGQWMQTNKNLVGGFIGDIEVDREYFDHPLNMVNYYAFGRHATDPDASADEIIRSWSEETYGKKAAGIVADVVKRTNVATSKMMYFKGAWIQNHSFLPPLDYLDSHLRAWLIKRDDKLIGWGRPLDLYAPEVAAKYAKDPDLELFTQRKEITPQLMDQLAKQQDEAVNEYEAMLAQWRTAKDLMGAEKYQRVEGMLEASLADAKIWRLEAQAYINFLLGKDYKPQVSEMEQMAAKGKGTMLVQQRIGEVLKSYRK